MMAGYEKRTSAQGRTSWRVVIRRKGYPVLRKTFNRKGQAVAWATATEAAMQAGRYRAHVGNSRTMGDLVSRYIVERLPDTRGGKQAAGELRQWRELLGDYDVLDLRPEHVATARDTLASTRAAGTVARMLGTLSRAFTVAIKDWSWLDENPCQKITRTKVPRGRVRFLSDIERKRLLTACFFSPCRLLGPLVRVAMLTGMRRGELLGLQWKDVDLPRRRLTLLETKNDERRGIPLTSDAQEILEALHHINTRGTDYVFHSPRTRGRPLNIDVHWPRAVKRARLVDFRFHDLRHTAASYLAMTGATTQEIAEILGHKTPAMVKRYAHLTETHSRNVLERMQDQMLSTSTKQEDK